MEKILQHSIVKQGLIIAYYFSNRWYRKCLFSETNIPVSNNTDPMVVTEADLDHSHRQKKAELTCAPIQEDNITEEIKQPCKEKYDRNTSQKSRNNH